jgi:hypothetical protein
MRAQLTPDRSGRRRLQDKLDAEWIHQPARHGKHDRRKTGAQIYFPQSPVVAWQDSDVADNARSYGAHRAIVRKAVSQFRSSVLPEDKRI